VYGQQMSGISRIVPQSLSKPEDAIIHGAGVGIGSRIPDFVSGVRPGFGHESSPYDLLQSFVEFDDEDSLSSLFAIQRLECSPERHLSRQYREQELPSQGDDRKEGEANQWHRNQGTYKRRAQPQQHPEKKTPAFWLGKATEEGRAALNSLRTTTTQTNDLAEALRRMTENGLIPSSIAVTFSVVGDAREMHAIVRDEIYRIGYEAIRNAFAHSSASRMEVELRYADNLALRVRDNGIGIDPAVADTGKDGHFGLQGMRERAARIGGKLTIESSTNLGTEIKLIVPGSIIFRKMIPIRRSLFTRIRNVFR
jgi:anti-sigma regulatory factor (Ser/Thr protein kinase)